MALSLNVEEHACEGEIGRDDPPDLTGCGSVPMLVEESLEARVSVEDGRANTSADRDSRDRHHVPADHQPTADCPPSSRS